MKEQRSVVNRGLWLRLEQGHDKIGQLLEEPEVFLLREQLARRGGLRLLHEREQEVRELPGLVR